MTSAIATRLDEVVGDDDDGDGDGDVDDENLLCTASMKGFLHHKAHEQEKFKA